MEPQHDDGQQLMSDFLQQEEKRKAGQAKMAESLDRSIAKRSEDAQLFRDTHQKVYYMHYRARAWNEDTRKRSPVPMGGITLAVTRENETSFRFGIAICSPEDQFSRRRGREIARGRMTCERWSLRRMADHYSLFGIVRCGPSDFHVPKRIWEHVLDRARDAVFQGKHGGRFGHMLDVHFAEADRMLAAPRKDGKS